MSALVPTPSRGLPALKDTAANLAAASDFIDECAEEGGARHGILVHVRLQAFDTRPGQHPVHQHPMRVSCIGFMSLHPVFQRRHLLARGTVVVAFDVLEIAAALRFHVKGLDLL